jgi:6-phosphofructokinase 1
VPALNSGEVLGNWPVGEHSSYALNARVVVLGYIQSGGSPTAADRLLATRLGVAAVQALNEGRDPGVVGVINGTEQTTPIGQASDRAPRLDPDFAELAKMLAGISQAS